MRTTRAATLLCALALACRGALADPAGMAPLGASDDRMLVHGANVCVRSDASSSSPRIATVESGRVFHAVGKKGGWVRVALDGGRTGWIAEQFLSPASAPAPTGGVAPLPPIPSGVGSAAQKAAPVPASAALGAAGPSSSAPASSFLDDAKPDPADRPNDGPAPTFGGGLRMLLYLLPVLALVVLGVRALKLVQQRVGVAPITRKGLIGGLIEANARRNGGGSIRVVESAPIGGVVLHLVEVRGKALLLGATAGSVAVLAEFEPPKLAPEEEFRAIMERARAEMFGPDPAAESNLVGAIGALDDNLRKAREAIARGVARSRTA